MTDTGTVVVGADGTPAARSAIEYALEYAEHSARTLRIIAVARVPQCWADGYGVLALPNPEEVTREMRTVARLQLEEVRRARPELAVVPVTVEALSGAPGAVLVDAARGADLLVLGHRGRGPVRSALLGSVGLHCVLHATCPVTIVRAAKAVEPAPGGGEHEGVRDGVLVGPAPGAHRRAERRAAAHERKKA